VRRPQRILTLSLPLAALAAVAHAAAAPTQAVEPYVSAAPADANAHVEAAATATPAAATPTPVITPLATAAPTPAPTAPPRPTVRPVPSPTAPPQVLRNLLRGPNGLNTGVGIYADCSGATALTHSEAAIDTCVSGVTYFVGHNPGVFTPLMTTNVGAVITWWDSSGTAHALRIVAARTWQRANGVPPPVSSAVVAQFQTCQVSDGSVDRILDAVPA
jgi:hypothetical protein